MGGYQGHYQKSKSNINSIQVNDRDITNPAIIANEFNNHFTTIHCVKIVRIWSYSGPYFPAFRLNTVRAQLKCGKMRSRITPNTNTFYVVIAKQIEVKLITPN